MASPEGRRALQIRSGDVSSSGWVFLQEEPVDRVKVLPLRNIGGFYTRRPRRLRA